MLEAKGSPTTLRLYIEGRGITDTVPHEQCRSVFSYRCIENKRRSDMNTTKAFIAYKGTHSRIRFSRATSLHIPFPYVFICCGTTYKCVPWAAES